MPLDFGASTAQFNSFVDFAQNQIDKLGKKGNDAIAGFAGLGDGANFGAHKIDVRTSDSVAKLYRSQDMKNTNNAIREIFKKSVSDIFGGEKNIPKNVLDAMKLEDFGKGKPLTARRILAVDEAIKNSVALHFNRDWMTPEQLKNSDRYEEQNFNSTTQYYENILQGIYSSKISSRPKEVEDMANYMVDHLVDIERNHRTDDNKRYGEFLDDKRIAMAKKVLTNVSWINHISDRKILETIADDFLGETLFGNKMFSDNLRYGNLLAKEFISGISDDVYTQAKNAISKHNNYPTFWYIGEFSLFAKDLLAQNITKYNLNEENTNKLCDFIFSRPYDVQLPDVQRETVALVEAKAKELANNV